MKIHLKLCVFQNTGPSGQCILMEKVDLNVGRGRAGDVIHVLYVICFVKAFKSQLQKSRVFLSVSCIFLSVSCVFLVADTLLSFIVFCFGLVRACQINGVRTRMPLWAPNPHRNCVYHRDYSHNGSLRVVSPETPWQDKDPLLMFLSSLAPRHSDVTYWCDAGQTPPLK